MKKFVLLVSLLFVLGCSTNGLIEDLYTRGAKPSSTDHLVFIGSEADFGWDTQVVITDRKVIDEVWHSILNSKPYARFSACGVRTIEFYSIQDSNTPLATLRVYSGGIDHGDPACVEGAGPFPWDSSKGDRVGLYECEGLEELVMKYLKEEYERRHKQERN